MKKISHYESIKNSKIDSEKGILFGVSVITEGNAKGHGQFIDKTTLQQVMDCAQKFEGGLKVKMNHFSGADSIIGKLDNFRIEANKLLGDLQLVKSSEKYDYILEIAQTMPKSIGLSISFSGSKETIDNIEYTRCTEIYSADLVDEPAANADGLFETVQEPTNKQVDTKINAMTPEELAAFKKNHDEQLKAIQDSIANLAKLVKPEVDIEKQRKESAEFAARAVIAEMAKTGAAATTSSATTTATEEKKDFKSLVAEKISKGMKEPHAIMLCVKEFPAEYRQHREEKLGFVTKNSLKQVLA